MRARRAAAAGLGLAAGLALAAAAGAQSRLGDLQGGGEALEITASEGIEWRRDRQVYIARGDARAVRGGVAVNAETLTAHYRRVDGEGRDIYRIDAAGGVTIVASGETVRGERATYDVDRALLVVTGEGLRLETGEDTVTARDSLEYWAERRLAVARGDAVAVRADRRIRAEVITAHLAAGEGGGESVRRLEAYGGVRIATPQEVVRGDKAAYDVAARVATVTGGVKITRGDNQLNGGYAEVNLDTGVSRLLGAPPGAEEGGRVRGLLMPGAKPAPAELPLAGGEAGPAEASEEGGETSP